MDWESGEDQPTYSQLIKLSKAYKRVSAVFFLPVPPKDPKLPKDFRVLSESKKKQLSPNAIIEIREAERKRQDALFLHQQLGEEIPKFKHKATLVEDIESLAKKFRDIFGLTEKVQKNFSSDYAFFNFWKTHIEKMGIFVFQASIKSVDELRGLAIYYKELPIILLNTKDTIKPRTFSLLHEFCHLLLHKSGIGNMSPNISKGGVYNDIEVFCNAFAAECMVPKKLLFSDPIVREMKSSQELSYRNLATLSNRFNASRDVILRRLLDGQKITQIHYEQHRTHLSESLKFHKPKASSGGPPYHIRMLAYNGEPFTHLALRSCSSKKITEVELSRFLGMKLGSIKKMVSSMDG